MFNLSSCLEDSARRYANKQAVICEYKSLTFSELNSISNQVANGLQNAGIMAKDKVALSCPNSYYFPAIYYGILKAGGVVVPLSVLLKRDEIRYHLKDADVSFYFCHEGWDILPIGVEGYAAFKEVSCCKEMVVMANELDERVPLPLAKSFKNFVDTESKSYDFVPVGAEDTAVIIYTSGTTGKPKGAELTHSNLAWNADLCRHLFQLKKDDITMTVLPMFHIFGQTCLMNSSIMHGISNVVIPRFDPGLVLERMQMEGVTIFAGVPTMYWALLNHIDDIGLIDYEIISRNLKFCLSGGASLPVQLLSDFESKFDVVIYEGYGMSEGSPVVTFNHPGQTRKAGSIGIPVWGVQVKLVDENDMSISQGKKGQLLYKGHNVMKGYYKKPKDSLLALKNGWMHSGDIAVQDEDGFYYIVDRAKDMILRGGLNVYPREVEEVIIRHESVSLVAIVGVPDEKMGEEIKAFIVLNKGARVSEKEILEWAKSKMALYKYPRIIEFISEMPLSATGKILKRELRK